MKLNCFRNKFTSDLEPSIILNNLSKHVNGNNILKYGISNYRLKFIKSNDVTTTFWLIPTPYLITQNIYIQITLVSKKKDTKIILRYFPSLWFDIILSLVIISLFAYFIHKSLLSSWTLPLSAIMIIICSCLNGISIYTANRNINRILQIASAH